MTYSDLPEELPDDFEEQAQELYDLTKGVDEALDNLLALLRKRIISYRGQMDDPMLYVFKQFVESMESEK